jgi:transcriptional regulator with GAF, ATPase, and Fis domain
MSSRTRQLEQEVDYLRKISSNTETEFVGLLKDSGDQAENSKDGRCACIEHTRHRRGGTGKEVIAKHIHTLMFGKASREGNPLSGELRGPAPPTLESELFRHEKGAFTDADRKSYSNLLTEDNPP